MFKWQSLLTDLIGTEVLVSSATDKVPHILVPQRSQAGGVFAKLKLLECLQIKHTIVYPEMKSHN